MIGECKEQMLRKHPQTTNVFPPLPQRNEDAEELGISDELTKVIKDLSPFTGVGPRGFRTHYVTVLEEGNFQSELAQSAYPLFEELVVKYVTDDLPRWLSRYMGGGMLTALAKAPPPLDVLDSIPGARADPSAALAKVDARPSKAEDTDTSVACKALAREVEKAVRDKVKPEQMAVGVPGAAATMVIGLRERYEEAMRTGKSPACS